MTILCGPTTDTISYVSKLICGHLVQIYDIRPAYGAIDILIDNQQIIPGVGSVSYALAPDFTERAIISLVSKNVAAGTATISFAIESIEVPPPIVEATHHLDFYLKPYSWYSPNGAADFMFSNITGINGRIANVFSGITGWQFVGSEILVDDKAPGIITYRIDLNQLEGAGVQTMALPAILATIITILEIALLIVVISVAIIVGYELIRYISNVVDASKQYTKKDVVDIGYDKVLPAQIAECKKNFSDPAQQANCIKSATCGAANGLTDVLGLNGTDCASLGINEKFDSCTAQYNIDHDLTKYNACIDKIVKDAGTETKNKTPQEGMGLGILLLVGGLMALAFISKGSSLEEEMIRLERERLRSEERRRLEEK